MIYQEKGLSFLEAAKIAEKSGRRFRYGSEGKWRHYGANDSVSHSMAMMASYSWEVEPKPEPPKPPEPPVIQELKITRSQLIHAISVELGQFYYNNADTHKIAPCVAKRLGFTEHER